MPSSTLISLYLAVAEERLRTGNAMEAMEMLLKTTEAVIGKGVAKQPEKVKMLKIGRNVVSLLNERPTETRITAAVECLESLVAAAPEEAAIELGPLFALTMNNLAELRKKQGNLEKAVEYIKGAVEAIEEKTDQECMRLRIISYMNLSELSSTVGNIDEAVKYAKAAAEASERSSEYNDIGAIQAIAFNNYAVQLAAMGSDLGSANEWCKRAIEKIKTCPDGGELEKVFEDSLKTIQEKGAVSATPQAEGSEVEASPQGPTDIQSLTEKHKSTLEQLDILESAPSSARHVTLPCQTSTCIILEDSTISQSETSVRVFTANEAIAEGGIRLDYVSNNSSCGMPYISTIRRPSSPTNSALNTTPRAMTLPVKFIREPTENPLEPVRQQNSGDTAARPELHQSEPNKVEEGRNFFLARMMNEKLDDALVFEPSSWKIGYDYGNDTFVVKGYNEMQWIVKLPA